MRRGFDTLAAMVRDSDPDRGYAGQPDRSVPARPLEGRAPRKSARLNLKGVSPNGYNVNPLVPEG